MKRGFIGFIAALLGASVLAFADINVTIVRPTPGQLSDDALFVAATVTSTFELSAVAALVEGRESKLVFSPSAIPGRTSSTAGWTNALSLAGLPHGAFKVTVTARDVFGNSGSGETVFTHDRKPILTVSAPLPNSVARPTIAVDLSCADDGPTPCAIRILANGQVIATNQVRVLDLSRFDHSSVTLRFEAIDSAGQLTSEERGVFVETNPRLTEAASVKGRIWDVQPDRILFREGSNLLKIHERSSGRDTAIVTGDHQPQYGFLTPRGAIFVASGNVFEWRDGSLLDLGQLNSQSSLVVKGDYAIWNVNFVFQDLMLRDLNDGTNVTVSRQTGNWYNDVAANGDVVFWSNDYKVYRYRGGATTLLSSDSTVWNTYPITDGTNVIYRKHGNGAFAIVLVNATGETTLVPALPGDATPDRDYRVNSGWVAYRKPGTGGPLQVWTRSPAGIETQLTFFGTSSSIEALSPNGEVIVSHAGNKYLSQPGVPLLDLGTYIGQTLWQGSGWHVVIGRTLFRLNPTDATLTVSLRNGQVAVAIRTASTQPIVIQASSDLVNWQTVSTVAANNGVAEFVDASAANQSLRFYRSMRP